jgi:hypothetical protein
MRIYENRVSDSPNSSPDTVPVGETLARRTAGAGEWMAKWLDESHSHFTILSTFARSRAFCITKI